MNECPECKQTEIINYDNGMCFCRKCFHTWNRFIITESKER